MTDTETRRKIAQNLQDNKTLYYSSWAAERMRLKLLHDHGLWEKERDAVLTRQKRENDALRVARTAQITADREKELQKRQEQEEARLKSELKRRYLSHPASTEADFERDYPALRSDYLRAAKRCAGMKKRERRKPV